MASIGGDLAEKIAATGEHSGIPPGFYLLTVWATLWPWTLLLPLAVVTGWAMRKRSPEGAFLLGWIVPTWPCSRRSRPSSSTTPFRPTPRFSCWPRCRWCGSLTGSARFAVGRRISGRSGLPRHARLCGAHHRRASRVRRRDRPAGHAGWTGRDARGRSGRRGLLPRTGHGRGHGGPRRRRDGHGLDAERRQPARRAGVLGHSPPGEAMAG
jgi:hypothetical protein